jgi:hypothetical protein
MEQESRTMTKSEAAKICQSIKFLMDKEDYSEEVEEALNMAIEALEQEPKWIPVTERLAEFPCIIQDANGNNPSVPSGIVTVESKEHGTWQIDGKFWTDKDLNPYLNWHNRNIAWQPLPEPYEESDE